MEARTKRGKIIWGKIAEIFVRKGIATPIEPEQEEKQEKPVAKKKSPAKRKPAKKK